MSSLSRRQFAKTAVATACACASCPSRLMAARPTPVSAGPIGEFKADGAWDKWAESGFILVRKGSKLYAVSSQCTHRSGQLAVGGAQIKCTKHNGVYSLEGEPVSGPPKRPLLRLGITLKDGVVVVDPAREYARGQWSDSGSFIAVA